MKRSTLLVPIFLLCLFSCTPDEKIVAEKEVTFSISGISQKEANGGGRTKSNADPKSVLVTIKDNSGTTVADRKELTLYKFGDNFLSLPFTLKTSGESHYRLTEFLVVDASNTIAYVSPKEGSAQAHLVADALDIEFAIYMNTITTVAPEVLAVDENSNAESYGYGQFGFNEVKTISAVFSAFTKGAANFELTHAYLKVQGLADTISQDTTTLWTYATELEAKANSVLLKKEAFYKITASKPGYKIWQRTIALMDGAKIEILFEQDADTIVSTFAGSIEGEADGVGSEARFTGPRAVAIDGVGNLYVVSGDKIRKISPAGEVNTLAGSTKGYADGSGSAAQFNSPSGIAVDVTGNLYVSDLFNHKIRKITPAGVVSTLAGSTRGHADGSGSEVKFNNPMGIAIDATGNMYVADHTNNRIRKVSTTGEVTTLAGHPESGFGDIDGIGAAARFNSPMGVATDAAGNVYVADSNQKIRRITPAGVVSTFAGSKRGFADGVATAAKFNFPNGITVDAVGNLYVADMENHKVRKITPTGEVSTLAGSTQGFADGAGRTAQFNFPYGVVIDATGNVIVTDVFNHKVRKITLGN